MMPEHAHHTPDPFHHVQDEPGSWHIFDTLFGGLDMPLGPTDGHGHPIPLLTIAGHDFYFTKFMFLELIAAALIIVIFVPIARRARTGELPKGWFWNCFESILTFIRNEVARPNIGDHEADKFVPLLWTMFLFILFCNLLGMIPFMGSPTASLWMTGGLAFLCFCVMHGAAIAKMGLGHYLQAQWPNVDAPYIGPLISVMIFSIELMGSVIKSGVLAVRLFANMFGGHMVLATLLLFIYQVGVLVDFSQPSAARNFPLWIVVTAGSVLGIVALSLLEIFVAFLQAYVFTYLFALFLGMALHPEH